MVESMTCSGCGAQRRVQRLPHGPRVVNHSRPGEPELVKEQREARAVLGLGIASLPVPIVPVTISDDDGDITLSVEEQVVEFKDRALATATTDLEKTAIYDAALALVEAAHRGNGEVRDVVLVEITVAKPTKVPCEGSGKAPRAA